MADGGEYHGLVPRFGAGQEAVLAALLTVRSLGSLVRRAFAQPDPSTPWQVEWIKEGNSQWRCLSWGWQARVGEGPWGLQFKGL